MIVAGCQINHTLVQCRVKVRFDLLDRVHVVVVLRRLGERSIAIGMDLHITNIIITITALGVKAQLGRFPDEGLQAVGHALHLLDVGVVGQSEVEHLSIGRGHDAAVGDRAAVGLQGSREKLGNTAIVPGSQRTDRRGD